VERLFIRKKLKANKLVLGKTPSQAGETKGEQLYWKIAGTVKKIVVF